VAYKKRETYLLHTNAV